VVFFTIHNNWDILHTNLHFDDETPKILLIIIDIKTVECYADNNFLSIRKDNVEEQLERMMDY